MTKTTTEAEGKLPISKGNFHYLVMKIIAHAAETASDVQWGTDWLNKEMQPEEVQRFKRRMNGFLEMME